MGSRVRNRGPVIQPSNSLRITAGLVAGLALVGWRAAGARAQSLTTEIPVERMHWVADRDGILDVPWGTVLPSLSLAAL